MTKSEREEIVSALASRILSTMVDEIVMDTVLQSHHEVVRSKAVCHVCHTRCGLDHIPGPSNAVQSSQAVPLPPSRATTPSGDAKATNGSSGTGASTPSSVKDGNIYFECLNCQRQIASTRYAPHLSSCLGFSTGTRRGATRTANAAKSKPSSPAGRSVSPSEAGNASDEDQNIKIKGKSKSNRADEAEFNLKRKRPGSPQNPPNKKQKKQSTSGSPVSRVRADLDKSRVSSTSHSLQPTTSQSKIPSKLRDSSTASFVASASSRSTSPAVTTPSSSAFSARSPSYGGDGPAKGNGGTQGKKRGRPSGKANGGPPKRPSPPKPQSPPRPPVPPIRIVEPEYTIDVEGEETGSSTDTDSS